MDKLYFRRRWEETRGDEFDDWGFSTWYFETDLKGLPIRQVECYDNGKVLKYDNIKQFDNYGQLGEHELDLSEFNKFEITNDVFESIWNKF